MLHPGDTIGILGGGQLARMLAMAAAPLGLKTHIYASDDHSPAFDVASLHTVGEFDDQAALNAFAASVAVITYETENLPLSAIEVLCKKKRIFPPPRALALTQDRWHEKTFIAGLGIAVPAFAMVETLGDLEAAIEQIGTPAVLKTRRFGYDGKGQVRIKDTSHLTEALDAISHQPAILEAFVSFEREISVIAARHVTGGFAAFTPPENVHRDRILATSTVPAQISQRLHNQAIAITRTLANALDYVGVLAVEFFVTKDERLLVNEIAPRVHNSGHWTIEACPVSQFSAHLRAICGWPLGNFTRTHDAVMTNLIGHDVSNWQQFLAEPDVYLHLYGKREARIGRKMGHVTRLKPLGHEISR